MKFTFVAFIPFCVLTSLAQDQQLQSRVYHWNELAAQKSGAREVRQILKSQTLDLDYLEIHASTLEPGQAPHASHTHENREELLIVKDGLLQVTFNGQSKILGPGSVAVALPGDEHGLQNAGETPVTYYIFSYRSKAPINIERGHEAGGSFMVDWDKVEFQKSQTGGRRQHFNRPTSMFENFEMHVSTLNEGLTNHQVHTHRAEECVLMIQGDVEMQIGDSTQRASAGDLIFLESQIPHNLKNIGNGPTEYFAFQWR